MAGIGTSGNGTPEGIRLHAPEDFAGMHKAGRFVAECLDDKTRFEKRIQKQKVNTFATQGGRRKLTSKDGKLLSACVVRDVFGILLSLSLEKKIDMEEVFQFPLTPYPLSMCHIDVTMQKTPK